MRKYLPSIINTVCFSFRALSESTILKLPPVPVVMVFTKFDKFQRSIRKEIVIGNRGTTADEVNALVERKVEEKLKENCLVPLNKFTGTEKFPYAVVSGKTLRRPNF